MLEAFSNLPAQARFGALLATTFVVGLVIVRVFLRPKQKMIPKKEEAKTSPRSATRANEVEYPVADVKDLKEGVMADFPAGEGRVLLIKDKDEITALAAKCTHLGAPLTSGVLHNGRIRCPWHGACFNAKTGDIEDYPCSDALQRYGVRVEGGKVLVSGPEAAFKSHKRVPDMCGRSAAEQRTFVILGGGPAGITCAETLRQLKFAGRVLMVCKEKALPYDRTKLSKAMSSTVESIALRKKDFLEQYAVETLLGVEVTAVDSAARTVSLSNGSTVAFDGLLIATGAHPRTLTVPGKELRNIFPIRVPEEANGVAAAVDGKHLVIVGSSFIGMEAASCLAKKAKSTVVIGMENVPFERVLGAKIGAALQRLYESNGVTFRLNQKPVKELLGQNGAVSTVVLAEGEQLPAEVVVLGMGVIPSTGFLAGWPLQRDGSIMVDQFHSVPEKQGVYAAGDLARYPYFLTNETIRVEHYGMAMYQGAVAAKNYMGQRTPNTSVPFFWTVLFGKSLRYAGHATSYDDVIIDGDLSTLTFTAFYVRGADVVAVATMNRDPVAAAAAELLGSRQMPSAADLRSGNVNLLARVSKS